MTYLAHLIPRDKPKDPASSDAVGRSRESYVKSLTDEDRKLIVITVVATVAANLLTVVMVGLAIIIAHNLRVTPDTPKSYFLLIPVHCHASKGRFGCTEHR